MMQGDQPGRAGKRNRLKERRKAIGLTQDQLARAAGVTRSTVVRWESGAIAPYPRQRPQLAQALRVAVDELEFVLAVTGPDSVDEADGYGRLDTVVVPAGLEGDDVDRREFLSLAGATLAGAMATPSAALQDLALVLVDQGPKPDPKASLTIVSLADGLARMKTAYQACEYQTVTDGLPELLTRIKASAGYLVGDDRLLAAATEAQTHHVAASVLLKLDNNSLAALAADRSMLAARRSEDPIMVAASARIVTHTLMASGQHHAAHRFAAAQAEELQRDVDIPTPDSISVYGALLLRGAVAAGMADDPPTARALLDEAEAVAVRLPGPANRHWTAFCLDNVHAHRLAVELLLGNAGMAIDSMRRIHLDNLGIAERKVTVCIDAARAYAQWGRHEQSITALLAAEQVSVTELQVRPVARDLVHHLRTNAPRSVQGELRSLSKRVGIAA